MNLILNPLYTNKNLKQIVDFLTKYGKFLDSFSLKWGEQFLAFCERSTQDDLARVYKFCYQVFSACKKLGLKYSLIFDFRIYTR